MARYFKFKSPEELVTEAAALGLELNLSADLAPLFQPVRIGTLTAGNRLLVQPMEGCDGTLDGRPDELTFRRYRRFGSGGAKVIWGEATAVCDAGRANSRQLLAAEHTAAGLEKMLRECRQAHRESCASDSELVVGLQLTHSGRYSHQKPLLATHDPILDPLTRDRSSGRFVDAAYPLLTDDDLKRIEDQFVAAAKLVAKIGYDFVELPRCPVHGMRAENRHFAGFLGVGSHEIAFSACFQARGLPSGDGHGDALPGDFSLLGSDFAVWMGRTATQRRASSSSHLRLGICAARLSENLLTPQRRAAFSYDFVILPERLRTIRDSY